MFVIVIVNIIVLEASLFFYVQYCDNFCDSHCVRDSTGDFSFLVNIQQCNNFGDNHCKCNSDRVVIA
jgi:hypothetical protein